MHSKARISALLTFEDHCLKEEMTFGDPFEDSGVLDHSDDGTEEKQNSLAAFRKRERESSLLTTYWSESAESWR